LANIEVARLDGTVRPAPQGVLERRLGGRLAEEPEVGAGESLRPGGKALHVERPQRPVPQVVLEDGDPGGRVGRQDQQGTVEAAGPAEGRIDVPRLIRRPEDEHPLVVAPGTVELAEQLDDDVAAGGALEVAALQPERVDLVEEEHAGGRAAGGLEDLVEVALALAEPHVEDLVEADAEEASPQLAGDRAGKEGLAAPRGAVEQQAAPERLPVHLAELRVAQGTEERGLEAALDLVEAADVGEGDPPRGPPQGPG